jgi:predicted DNA-binding transcriptional regulator AlpA
MPKVSTNQVAKTLGIGVATLTRHIQSGKVTAPKPTMVGGMRMRLWSESDVERLRAVLPKIRNGRKTRYAKHKGEPKKKQ